MVAMTPLEFREKTLSVLRKDSGRKKVQLSEPQKTILVAAYGVYAREVGIQSDTLKERISELKISLAEKETEIIKEQTKTIIALMWNNDTARQIGAFFITPINEWALRIGHEKNNGQRVSTLERASYISDEHNVGKNAEYVFVQEGKSEFTSNNLKENNKIITENSVEKLPWVLWMPTMVLSRIFGGMTPLSFALLLLTVVSGAILYGQYARSVWKDQYDAELAANKNLMDTIGQKDQQILSLEGIKSRNDELEIDLQEANIKLDQSYAEISSLNNDLSANNKEFNDYKIRTAEKHSEELQRFQSNISEAAAQRDKMQTSEINRLQNEISSLKGERIKLEQDLGNLKIDYSSASSAEKDLREKLSKSYEEYKTLSRENTNINTRNINLDAVIRVLAGIPVAVNKYFWHKEGILEKRRACFRLFYRNQMSVHKDKLRDLNVVEDMPWANYDLEKDSLRRLVSCDIY